MIADYDEHREFLPSHLGRIGAMLAPSNVVVSTTYKEYDVYPCWNYIATDERHVFPKPIGFPHLRATNSAITVKLTRTAHACHREVSKETHEAFYSHEELGEISSSSTV